MRGEYKVGIPCVRNCPQSGVTGEDSQHPHLPQQRLQVWGAHLYPAWHRGWEAAHHPVSNGVCAHGQTLLASWKGGSKYQQSLNFAVVCLLYHCYWSCMHNSLIAVNHILIINQWITSVLICFEPRPSSSFSLWQMLARNSSLWEKQRLKT